MKKVRLKKWVVYSLFSIAVIAIFGTIIIVNTGSTTKLDEDYDYVDDTIIEIDYPVSTTYDTIMRPYVASNVSIARNFYDHMADSENQQNSLIYYEGTYIPNTGVDYISDEVFDVIAIFQGEVTNIFENTLLGKVIEVTHENNMVSLYQSLSETEVVIGDSIIRGQVIGKSGTANISADLGNHLHFEVIHNGININPELVYDKKVGEL